MIPHQRTTADSTGGTAICILERRKPNLRSSCSQNADPTPCFALPHILVQDRMSATRPSAMEFTACDYTLRFHREHFIVPPSTYTPSFQAGLTGLINVHITEGSTYLLRVSVRPPSIPSKISGDKNQPVVDPRSVPWLFCAGSLRHCHDAAR